MVGCNCYILWQLPTGVENVFSVGMLLLARCQRTMLSPAVATLMFSISLSIFCSHIVTCILYLAAAGAIYLLWYTASQGETASASPSPFPLFLSSTAWKPYLNFYKVTEGLVLCHQKSLKGLLWQMLDSPDTGNLCTAASQNSACEETKTVSLHHCSPLPPPKEQWE